MNDVRALNDWVSKESAFVERVLAEVGRVVVGQQTMIERILIGLLTGGHVLLEGVPGLAKTTTVRALCDAISAHFARIQFTPDLMPSDIVGSEILDEHRQFKFIAGPIFSNIILADEINRTPPKTQSALLEAMQERKVTAAGQTMSLPSPFFVLATQNPIEQEGTYPLPEAQLDRFMFNIWVDYPTLEEEIQIVKATTDDRKVQISPVIQREEIMEYQNVIRKMPVADNVVEYAVKLVNKTRPESNIAPDWVRKNISWGAGPRASQHLIVGAKCHAALNGKLSPDIEDVKAVALPILRHRVVRNYKAEAEGLTIEKIVAQLM